MDADEGGCLSELLRVSIPVGAELQRATESGQYGKSTMSMNAPFELTGLGPGVGIEQPMAVQFDAAFCKAKPKRLGFSAKQQIILPVTGLMFCQSMSGLIDTDHQCIRVCFRDERGAHAGAAE